MNRPESDPARSPSPLAVAGGAALLLLLAGCASTPAEESSGTEGEASPYVPLPLKERPSAGFFLAEFDNKLRVWSTKTLEAKTDIDWRLVHTLEEEMGQEAWKHRDELIQILEGGAPRNREVAAAALGFTKQPEVLSPLLNALSDPEPAVIQKALLGLGVLADSSTPLSQILFALRSASDPWTRVNAAYALYRIVLAGGGDDNLGPVCQEALLDEEWGVRSQCASILGLLGNVDSIEALGELLRMSEATTCHATAVALRRIAQKDPSRTGQVARMLVDALARAERLDRSFLLEELAALRGANLGMETGPWREWAYGLR